MNIRTITASRHGILINAAALGLRSMRDMSERSIVIAKVRGNEVIDTVESIALQYGSPVQVIALLANPLAGGYYGISKMMEAFLRARDFDPMMFSSLTDTALNAMTKEEETGEYADDLISALVNAIERKQFERVMRNNTVSMGRTSFADMLAALAEAEAEEETVEIDWSDTLYNAYGEVKVSQRSDDDETGTRVVSFKTPYGKVRYPVCVETGEPALEGFDPAIFSVDNINPDDDSADEGEAEADDNMESFKFSDSNLPKELVSILEKIAGKDNADKVIVTGGCVPPELMGALERMFGKDSVSRM